MPTVDQYAASIVEKYHVLPHNGSPAHRAVDEIIPLVKQWAKQYLLGITISGAYAKNTAVTLSSHADVLIALAPIPNMEMQTVFWNLFEFLSDRSVGEAGLRPRTKEVCMQVACKGLKIDLIPACRDQGSSGNLLFNKKSGVAVQTDIAQHIHSIANSGRQQEICALKIWRERQDLDFPSLCLEATVLRALEGERFGQLADNVLTVLRHLASRLEEAPVCDPANPKNILSDDLSTDAKRAIAKAARDALYHEDWDKIIW